jgi:hypothetical protein
MRCKSALLAAATLLLVASPVHAAYPITGSFVSADLGGDAQTYKDFVREMADTGIDTIIVPIGAADKNCTTNAYTDSFFLDEPNRHEADVIRAAFAANMKVFFGLREPYWSPCINFTSGTPTDTSTDMGHLIAHSVQIVSSLQAFLTRENISWSDPRIAGLYITEEITTYYLTDSFPTTITYFQELSRRLKAYGKPILISPWQENKTDYALSLQAYKNLIGKTDITIIAPQDSFGTGKTTDFAKGRDHFRALADAKNAYPNKNTQIWANIEIFTGNPPSGYKPYIPGKPSDTFPAPFTRIQQQIAAATPYVSKMITWIYQYSLLTIPQSVNAYNGWNLHYTPDLYPLRQALRTQYVAAYGGGPAPSTPTLSCSPLYVYSISEKKCQATNAPYTTDQYQCVNGNKSNITCAQNLASQPGTTTGICYSTLDLCSKATDLTGDGVTNATDFSKFVQYFSEKNAAADLNKDGVVDIFDYNMLTAYYR